VLPNVEHILTGWGQITAGAVGFDAYIAVGDKDHLATSADGLTWTTGSFNGVLNSQCLGSACDWTGVAASATATHKYVAIGTYAPGGVGGALAYSDDAVTWTAVMNGPSNAIDVIWDGSRYVTAGLQGEVCSSADGATWTCSTISALASAYPSRIIYTGSTYVMVGLSAASKGLVATSTDLSTWTIQASAAAATSNDIVSVAFANGLLVAGTMGGGSIQPSDLITSSDQGVTWTKPPSAAALGNVTIGAVGWTGKWWVAVVGSELIVSMDGVTWEDDGPAGPGPALAATTLGQRGMVILLAGGVITTVEK
jgi:hypothetical protein